ncbi:tyrosine-type recombinase/integrase [Nocardia pseudobrasiliensis]|uniref:Site-specific recombinase XerD n=1 Tax=Nocardia pseudobrasiliensis TaxID=45979 RepID=A0A370HN06_9NOCA|nr:site-specific integrase [Nocardia pseudobrasiliensis]RDI59615.1 site-specific recombinase XerD [Nocardia pseudobrasiliensis]
MTTALDIPVGLKVTFDIEELPRGRSGNPFRARARWTHPQTKKRDSKSVTFESRPLAEDWIERMSRLAGRGIDPLRGNFTLLGYAESTALDTEKSTLELALRGLDAKTLDPYLSGWRRRVVPTLGHLPLVSITYGMVDRAIVKWIEEQACSKSTIKNTIAVLVRVMEQAKRDGYRDDNPARVRGWQELYKQIEDELKDPRALAIPNWDALVELCDALVEASFDHYRVWGDVVMFAACTAARIGEVSGCRLRDIDTESWVWTIRRQTTMTRGGLIDKGTKGNRARKVPIIEEIRPMILARIAACRGNPDARLFLGRRGGCIATASLRRATNWDKVVHNLGYDHLVRHTLRHTGLTWFADAGVPLHRLQKIAGHSDPRVTELYLRVDTTQLEKDAQRISKYLKKSAPQDTTTSEDKSTGENQLSKPMSSRVLLTSADGLGF